MNKGGIGVGSASIVLVFAVLCLTVFSLITFVVAENDKGLVDANKQLMTGYYSADSLAERVFAELIESGSAPDSVLGVNISTDFDSNSGVEYLYYSCPISEDKAINVKLAVNGDSYDILSWRMGDTGDWEADNSMNVWLEPDDVTFGDPMGILPGN